jgi:two-component system response regulator QseB
MQALVVEDEDFIANLLVRLLARRGISAVVAGTRAEAFALLAAGSDRFALAYVDVGLPDGSGIDVLTELRASGSPVPTILATGRLDDVGADVHAFLRKPFTLVAFDEAVRACLASPAVCVKT